MDSKFYDDVAFGLELRHFSEKQDENDLYDEKEDVLEIFYMLGGTVGISFQDYQRPLDKISFLITHQISCNSFFGDY